MLIRVDQAQELVNDVNHQGNPFKFSLNTRRGFTYWDPGAKKHFSIRFRSLHPFSVKTCYYPRG